MTDAFVKFPKLIMQSSHWVSLTTGELIVLTPMQKIIWLHIKDRHDFFVSQGLSFYENVQTIADTLCCDRSTVTDFLRALDKHGYLCTTKRIVQGFIQSNAYEILADLKTTRVPKQSRAKPITVLVVDAPVLPHGVPFEEGTSDDPFAGASVVDYSPSATDKHAGIFAMHV